MQQESLLARNEDLSAKITQLTTLLRTASLAPLNSRSSRSGASNNSNTVIKGGGGGGGGSGNASGGLASGGVVAPTTKTTNITSAAVEVASEKSMWFND